jgi:hypothetical protein
MIAPTTMSGTNDHSPRSQPPGRLASLGGRAVSLTLRPLSAAGSAAFDVGIDLERTVVEHLLDSPQFDRLVTGVMRSDRLHDAITRLLESDNAKQLIDQFFDSGLFDQFLARLADSDALWDLIDRIAASPTVTAAITQQGLGFADQVGAEVRTRSRKADDWIERTARRLTRRRNADLPPGLEAPEPSGP